MTIFIPIKLTNSNTGRGHHWGASASFRDKAEKKLRALGLARAVPFPCRVNVIVTRILGKGERLWDSSSVLRGNWKEIEDSLVAIGWFVDDSTQYIATTDGRQDDTRRNKGPGIELTILPAE